MKKCQQLLPFLISDGFVLEARLPHSWFSHGQVFPEDVLRQSFLSLTLSLNEEEGLCLIVNPRRTIAHDCLTPSSLEPACSTGAESAPPLQAVTVQELYSVGWAELVPCGLDLTE